MSKKTIIEELDSSEMPDTIDVVDGYYIEQIADATPCNMEVLISKINQLVNEVNRLKQFNRLIK